MAIKAKTTAEIRCSFRSMTFKKMEYAAIQKGRGLVYAHANQLYDRVRTAGVVKYLNCCVAECNGSAKLVSFFVGVSDLLICLL